MNVRIQTFGECYKSRLRKLIGLTNDRLEGTTAIQALQKGLQDLQELCDIVTDKFIDARERYAATTSS